VAHAHHVAEQFRAQGWRAVAVDGSAKVADRDAAIAGLVTGEVEVLCSCELISEGLDVPAVSAVILLRPTQSLAMYLQMVGRGMRPARGKRYLTVLDHAGNAIRHGLPDVRREWRLGADAPKVRAPAIRQCPICFAVHAPGPRCPGCGHVYTRAEAERRLVRAKDGTLTELSADDYRLQVTPLRQLVKDAQTRAEVEQIAAARGYSDVWVDITMSHKRPRREKTTAAQDFAA
jgi:superfamily II DNA or RNA helicase